MGKFCIFEAEESCGGLSLIKVLVAIVVIWLLIMVCLPRKCRVVTVCRRYC
ncbi:hypothetical protein QJS10_CPB18g00800 [Acorus calamus]|uniref:Uncharacterized protein n=1 Tax=Acorus calamus TaxID=4465 RepID=A0AAV9CQK4_ACOCL|nr:hypothetical protein QJS10_CPB18g00800 [Acorus calamus]